MAVSTNEPLEIGDELWLYYTEANGAHPIAPFEKAVSQILAAVWRKDGFVSMDCEQQGRLMTVPCRFDGKTLRLNFKTQDGGSIRVGLCDEQGKPYPGFDLTDCDRLDGDAVARTVSWKSQDDLSAFAGKPVRLRFEMSRCQLWSLQFPG